MQKFIDQILASLIRTVVPVVVGLVLSYALKANLHLDDQWVTDAVTLAVTTGFYALVRVLETFVSSKFGWLLGLAKTPTYVAPDAAV